MAGTERIETVVVGAGQAGLATSYWLTRHGYAHLVLESSTRPGHVWHDDRWDSFTLVTPNWTVRLPGAEYIGDEPDGFLPRDEIVAYLARYAAEFNLPIQYGMRVNTVEQTDDGWRYRVRTTQADYEADNVVIATGAFQRPKIPGYSAEFPASVTQLHTGAYRRPEALEPGAVLIVGSGQSGCQIAEELYQSGRRVYLSVGRAARIPRRYRGLDANAWMYLLGLFERTVEQLPNPHARFEANPHLTGKDGGHSLNLHAFARDGVTLLGHLRAVRDGRIVLAGDLKGSLAEVDKKEAEFSSAVDTYILRIGMDAPAEELPRLTYGYAQDDIGEVDLAAADIRTVIWAGGYSHDFSLVKLPVVDDMGYPMQSAGITRYPGLYFVGLPWLRTKASGLFFGVGADAAWIAGDITRRRRVAVTAPAGMRATSA